MGVGIIKRRRKSAPFRALCEQLEARQLYNGVGMATADKDSTTLFGNVTMVNSAAYEAQLSSGTSFTSTLGSLPAHTELSSVGFTVNVSLGDGEDANNVVFSIAVDGQSVPVYFAWVQPGLAAVSMNLSMLPHISDTAGISLTVSEPSSSDTFDVTSEEVAADQDAWITAVQPDAYRDNDQPAVFDLFRGDDNGTPQAPTQSQDIYFNLADGGYTPGLVNADGTISPVDPSAAYADFGLTVAGQNGGVSYDPSTGFKVTIPANQSSVELDVIPTNPPGVADANAFFFQIDLQGAATDPNTQIGFEFNAPAMQPVQGGALHGLVAVDSTTALDDEELQALLGMLDSDSNATRNSGTQQLETLVAADPSLATYNQLLQAETTAAADGDANLQERLQLVMQAEFPLGPLQVSENNNELTGIVWPQDQLNFVTDDTQIEVTITTDNGTVQWDDAGQGGSHVISASNTSESPGILLTPTHTGLMTITISMQRQNASVLGVPQNTDDAPLVATFSVMIMDTNP